MKSTCRRIRSVAHACGDVSGSLWLRRARHIGLGDFVFLGRGSPCTGDGTNSILSDTFEALIGGTYLTSGLEEARRVILARLGFLLVDAPSRGQHQDWKTLLVSTSQSRRAWGGLRGRGRGPDHQHVFTARATCPAQRLSARGRPRRRSMQRTLPRDAMKRLAADEE